MDRRAPRMIDGSMKGKICIVTGANQGIGKATVEGLARKGASLVMVCRNRKRGEAAIKDILSRVKDASLELMIADLSSKKAIHGLAKDFKKAHDKLDVLLNNAAIMPRHRTITVDGIETQLAVNHLAPFLLTHLLLDVLRRSAPSRIITVSSSGHKMGRLDFDDLEAKTNYRYFKQYTMTKLANIHFTVELSTRMKGTDVSVNCLHPGVIATGLYRSWTRPTRWFISKLFNNPIKGARTSIYVASSEDLEGISGQYFSDMKLAKTSSRARNEDDRRRLWNISIRMTGLTSFWK